MKTLFSTPWRLLFISGGILMFIGGPMHPGGTMAEMLVHPDWFLSHFLMSMGFVSWTGAWFLLRRSNASESSSITIAFWATLAQMIESWFHTFAYLDATAFAEGGFAPIVSTHLFLAPWVGLAYGISMAYVIIRTQRTTGPGTVWIGWIGVIGALGHGAAYLLVGGFDLESFRVLFPTIVLLGLWHILSGCLRADR